MKAGGLALVFGMFIWHLTPRRVMLMDLNEMTANSKFKPTPKQQITAISRYIFHHLHESCRLTSRSHLLKLPRRLPNLLS